jgi:RHS repeat-associated protein
MFQGRRLDEETGLYYYRNRYYSATLGRFVTRDPKGYGDGYNLYQFAGSRVLRATDPIGLDYIDIQGDVVLWVTQSDGWVWNSVDQRLPLGDKSGKGYVKLRQGYGGGCIKLSELKRLAENRFLADITSKQRAFIAEIIGSGQVMESSRSTSMWWQHFYGTSEALSPDMEKYNEAYQGNRLPLDTWFDVTQQAPMGVAGSLGSSAAGSALELAAKEAAKGPYGEIVIQSPAFGGNFIRYTAPRVGMKYAGYALKGLGWFSAGVTAGYSGWGIGNHLQAWQRAYDH